MAEVSYTLTVAGQPADGELLASVQSLEVEDHADLADMLRLRIAIAVASGGSHWNVVDDGLFDRLANLRVAAKVGTGRAEPVIDAYVIDSRAAFSSEPGRSVLEVVAMDATALLSLEEKVKSWPDQADSAIASSIFSDYGFTANVRDSQPVRQQEDTTTIQRGTDIAFLRKLAERNGYETYVEVAEDGGTEGHFHPPELDDQPQAVLNVNLGSDTNVDDFNARYDMLAATTAQVTGLDVSDGSTQAADAQNSRQTTLGGSSAVAADRPRKVLLSGTALSSAGELQTLAQAVVDRSAFAITAEGTVHGAAIGTLLKAKKPVLVRGAGREFSGTYYVQRVRHVFSGEGHAQRFSLRRNASGLTRQEQFRDDDAVAPQPAVQI
jgi:phage protein D